MILDASLVIDAVADPGPQGAAARAAIAALPAAEPLIAPGHFAIEVLSGLRAAANRPLYPLQPEDVAEALRDAEAFQIQVEATPWADVHRAWALSRPCPAPRYATPTRSTSPRPNVTTPRS